MSDFYAGDLSDDRLLVSEEEGDSMFGDQFKMMGVETPVKQEIGARQVVTNEDLAEVKVKEALLVQRKEMLLMLASTVGEESGAGLLSEKESHCQAAYDAYDEQEVQVLCSVAPRVLSDRAASSSFLEEELLGSYRLERDNLGFYTEHPIPEKQVTDRYNDIYCVSNTL